MRTAIVSDLHLGSAFGEDVARDAAVRRLLIEEVAGADRLVLLGDVLELREKPLPATLEAARPFFEEVGAAMAGRRVVLVPGNHDHRLAEPLLEELALGGRPLGLEHHAPPAAGGGDDRSPAGSARRRARPRLPGGLAARRRLRDPRPLHGLPHEPAPPRVHRRGDRDAALRPGPDPATPVRLRAGPAAGLRLLLLGSPSPSWPSGRPGPPSAPGGRSQAGAARAAGSGEPCEAPRSGPACRRRCGASTACCIPTSTPTLTAEAIAASGVDAATELAERLGVGGGHLITGHTHRGGPGENDGEWALRGGGSLHNTGSWIFASAFHHPGTPPGPYWPGTVTWVEDDQPPRRVRLLDDSPREDLAEVVGRQRTRREP